MQAFLSREICSLKYPVYAEEISALLAQLAAADITTKLQNFDPNLARFICERARFLRDKITALGEFLPTLQNFLSAEQRLLSLAQLGHSADERAIQKASDVLYRSVFDKLGDVAATRALLGLSVDNLRTGGTVAPAVTITLEPSASPTREDTVAQSEVIGDGNTATDPARHRRHRPSVDDFDFSN